MALEEEKYMPSLKKTKAEILLQKVSQKQGGHRLAMKEQVFAQTKAK